MASFESFELPEQINKSLESLKFETPTEVQAATIPKALEGYDVIATAETGSGKTAAYLIPVIKSLIEDESATALVMAPTRELVQQIVEVARELIKNVDKLRATSLVGGADIRKQLKALQNNPRLVIATPGRLTDHLKRRSVKLNKVEVLVLDEGDRMIDMGFAPQLDIILKYLPERRQTLFFTATLPDKVARLAQSYLHKPQRITVGKTSVPVSAIKQSVVQATSKNKDDLLMDELNKRQGSIIIFTKTKVGSDSLTRVLSEYGYAVSQIHGDRTQGQRNKAISGFKKGQFRILCATDIAARGLDVPHVEHVINYDLPMLEEDYVHRIGRTARNGAKGEAVTFVLPKDQRSWASLVRKYKIPNVTLKDMPREPFDESDRQRGRKKFKSKSSSDVKRGFKKKRFGSGGKPSGGGFKKKSSGRRPQARA